MLLELNCYSREISWVSVYEVVLQHTNVIWNCTITSIIKYQKGLALNLLSHTVYLHEK